MFVIIVMLNTMKSIYFSTNEPAGTYA